MPWTLVTPEHLAWAEAVVSDFEAGRSTPSPEEQDGLFDRTFFQQSTDVERAAVFAAARAGTTTLVGIIGAQVDSAPVVIRPPGAPRP